MAFDKKVPTWGAPGVEPPESKKQEGWQVNDKPPAAWWNWFMNLTSEALKELQEKAAEQAWVQEQINAIDVDIQDASLTQKGIVQLSSALNSISESLAATPKAVKSAYDEALAAKQLGVEQKANVVAALNSIGVTASTSETWAQLIPKIAAIIRATGNATSADLLDGKSASNANGPFNGSMPNRGAVSQTITTQNGSYTIPQGYHNGSGVIKATFANLIASNIRSGVNVGGIIGSLVEGIKYATASDGRTILPGQSINIDCGFTPRIFLVTADSSRSTIRDFRMSYYVPGLPGWQQAYGSAGVILEPQGYLAQVMTIKSNAILETTLSNIIWYAWA